MTYQDLPAAFCFAVRIGVSTGFDTSFQEVSGIGTELETMAYAEGGENRFAYSLPKAVKHQPLTLKRGVAGLNSSLVAWCKKVLENGLGQPIETHDITVSLLDFEGNALRSWSFANAYPQGWSIDPFVADKSAVAIEKVVLAYTAATRTL